MNLSAERVEEVFSSTRSRIGIEHMEVVMFRQVAYRLFTYLFLYPEDDNYKIIRSGAQELLDVEYIWEEFSFAPSFKQLLEAFTELPEEIPETLLNEFNRLLWVKPIAPPYESYYLAPDGRLRGNTAADLEGVYRNAGLGVSSKLNELPDHVAVELEFMSFLCSKEVEGMNSGNDQETAAAQEEQRKFLGQHLGVWFPKFAKQVKSNTKEPIYNQVVDAAFQFLRSEMEYLKVR
ncbi:MAG: molecular chaperone TorD family protein [Chloroflexi bacterium]|nr:molecular chaperone TorD family protein [Chloroflexota bacterium]